MDPLQDKYPFLSPYSAFADNPLNIIDPSGAYLFGLIGSTSEQRKAAKKLATETGGTVVNKHKKSIAVVYDKQIEFRETPIIYKNTQHFNKDGSLIPQEGEIKEIDPHTYFEMWLDSPRDNAWDVLKKGGANILYDFINSPYILLTGNTLAGSEVNSNEKIAAFTDVETMIIAPLLKATNIVTKTAKGATGLNKWNDFIKRNSGILKNRGGKGEGQKAVKELFQQNTIQQEALKNFSTTTTATSIIEESKKE